MISDSTCYLKVGFIPDKKSGGKYSSKHTIKGHQERSNLTNFSLQKVEYLEKVLSRKDWQAGWSKKPMPEVMLRICRRRPDSTE